MVYLMHKNIPVAEIKLDANHIIGFEKIFYSEELPIGLQKISSMLLPILLNKWEKSRSVPLGRIQIDMISQKLGITPEEGFMLSHGVSLTDTYWIKEEKENLFWEDINYHQNGFVSVFGKIYSGESVIEKFPSPDYTTDGMMEKFWISNSGLPYLVKMDNQYHNLQTANEVVASQIGQILFSTEIVPYYLTRIKDKKGCICPCFITDADCDYIPANQLIHQYHFSEIQMIQYFDSLGLQREIRDMITLDVLLGNTDRHSLNYGLIYSEDGIKMAPIFDSGSCLSLYRTTAKEIKFPNTVRNNISEDYLSKVELEESVLFHLLQSVYEDFDISEECFEKAKEELLTGIQILQEKEKIFVFEKGE